MWRVKRGIAITFLHYAPYVQATWALSRYPISWLSCRLSHLQQNSPAPCVWKSTRLLHVRHGQLIDPQKKVSANPRSTNKGSFGLQTHKFCWDCSQLYCCSTSSEKPEERTSTHLPPSWTVKILKATRDLVNSTLKASVHLHEVFIIFQYGGLQRCTCTLISAHFLYNRTPFFVFCWLTVFFLT